ncbi:MAG: branched-chain amino acid ABC transporter permease [Anaerolineae bacterium]|jgi:branched-chain amino acid transport system permease protein|nr:branched-chain amino acid ABC transporter permease [Anaerolineae bacterium]MDX9830545.1 branched-chain amino acid ABC transporter permease [Anaerolineae bacterium]
MTAITRFQLRNQWAWASGALVIALIAPLILPSYWLHVVIVALFYAALASSWSFLAGYAGQFSWAHMAFMAIGAYTSGILGRYLNLPPLPGMVLGTLASGLAGLAIGALVLRFKATYLALFTIAFSEILRIVLKAEADITRGDLGLSLAPLFGNTISKAPYYYTMLAILLGSLLVLYWLTRSRVGMFVKAIREDEQAAAARGVDVVRYKVLSFVVTSMIAGLAGTFSAHYITIITPNILVLPQMGVVMAMAIIGGVESLIAAALGGIIIQVSLELLREFGAWRLVLFGALLVITLRFARNGLIAPLFQRLFHLGPRAELQKEATSDGA